VDFHPTRPGRRADLDQCLSSHQLL
jgi:hypothetical protein